MMGVELSQLTEDCVSEHQQNNLNLEVPIIQSIGMHTFCKFRLKNKSQYGVQYCLKIKLCHVSVYT